MSASRNDVDELDRLVRVKLNCTIEPGDLRVTGLVSELGASKVLGYLEAAADADAHWAFSIGQQLADLDPARVLQQAADRGIRFASPPTPSGPTGSVRCAMPAPCTSGAACRSGCG
jgi:DNA processing protein